MIKTRTGLLLLYLYTAVFSTAAYSGCQQDAMSKYAQDYTAERDIYSAKLDQCNNSCNKTCTAQFGVDDGQLGSQFQQAMKRHDEEFNQRIEACKKR